MKMMNPSGHQPVTQLSSLRIKLKFSSQFRRNSIFKALLLSPRMITPLAFSTLKLW